jgi:hypothetical protein
LIAEQLVMSLDNIIYNIDVVTVTCRYYNIEDTPFERPLGIITTQEH